MLKTFLCAGMFILWIGLPNDSGAQSILGEARCISGYCTQVGVSKDWHVECTKAGKGTKWCIAAPWTKIHADPRSYEIASLRVEVWQHEGEVQSHVKIDGAVSAHLVKLDVDGDKFVGRVSPTTQFLGWEDQAALRVIQAFRNGWIATYKTEYSAAGEAAKKASLIGFAVAWRAITQFIGQDPLRVNQ